MEIWRDIIDHPNHQVSNIGRVRNKKTGRIMHQFINTNGYYVLTLNNISCRTHRLIAEAFIEKSSMENDVNHIDGDKLNNNVENLEWCTRKENIRHAFNNGLSRSNLNEEYRSLGTKSMMEKTSIKVRVIETGEIYSSIKECARRLNCSPCEISKCCKGLKSEYKGYHFEFV